MCESQFFLSQSLGAATLVTSRDVTVFARLEIMTKSMLAKSSIEQPTFDRARLLNFFDSLRKMCLDLTLTDHEGGEKHKLQKIPFREPRNIDCCYLIFDKIAMLHCNR
jgi:hypothetical protein